MQLGQMQNKKKKTQWVSGLAAQKHVLQRETSSHLLASRILKAITYIFSGHFQLYQKSIGYFVRC